MCTCSGHEQQRCRLGGGRRQDRPPPTGAVCERRCRQRAGQGNQGDAAKHEACGVPGNGIGAGIMPVSGGTLCIELSCPSSGGIFSVAVRMEQQSKTTARELVGASGLEQLHVGGAQCHRTPRQAKRLGYPSPSKLHAPMAAWLKPKAERASSGSSSPLPPLTVAMTAAFTCAQAAAAAARRSAMAEAAQRRSSALETCAQPGGLLGRLRRRCRGSGATALAPVAKHKSCNPSAPMHLRRMRRCGF